MSVQGYKYVIEHMEDDDATTTSVPPWVRLEYAQMLKNAGKQSKVLFTSLSASSAAALPGQLASAVGDATNVAACEATTTPILDLLATAGPNGTPVPISKVCLLDPKAPLVLSPADGAPGAFEFFLFGGILGDDPPRDRTGELRKLGFETRHLGSVQMTTDTVSFRRFLSYRELAETLLQALGVTKIIIDDKIPLDEITYVVRRLFPQTASALTASQDHPTIRFNDKESVEMPFRTSCPFSLTVSSPR